MKKFFDSKDEKITEKAFSQSLIVSVLSILLCIVALCSMTYAWFTEETESGNNKLVSGSFDVIISVTKTDNNGITTDIPITEDPLKAGVYNCSLSEGTYTVKLKLTQEATVKGHCIVTINDSVQYTDAIVGEQTKNRENRVPNDPFTFTLKVEKDGTVVTFEPRWGVIVNPNIYPDPTNDNNEISQDPIE